MTDFDSWFRSELEQGQHPFTVEGFMAAREWAERDLARHVAEVNAEEASSSYARTLAWFKQESRRGINYWR